MKSAPFKIYSASAGSGKTFTLVKEYLKVCLQAKSHQKFISILAITFTNKAAAEMKARIIKSLKAFSKPALAGQTELDMMRLIVEETGITKKILQDRAQRIFEAILHNYSQLSIGTIDKFTHRIIRTFAQDLSLPANFEVEMEHQALLKRSVDFLIGRSGEDKKLTRLFVNFIQDKTANDKSWMIENDFYSIAEELLKESGQVYCERLNPISLDDFSVLRQEIYKYINKIDLELSTIGSEFSNHCSSFGILPEWISGGKSGIPKYFEYLRTNKWENYVPSKTNSKNFEKENWYSSKAPRGAFAAIDSIQKKFYPLVQNALNLLREYPKYVLFKLIARNFYSMAVLNEISKEMGLVKAQNNIVPIGEFNKKIADVLQNEEGSFIYERLGERYANYFIDEFQDTSVLQWKNLLPLIENAIADGLKPGSVMVVGDAKQAIYRWRGGEVNQFIGLQQLALNTSPVVPYKIVKLSLENNYRSSAEIVNFNNKLFSSIAHLLEDEKYQTLFKGLNARHVKGAGGYVSLEYIQNDEEHDETQKKRCLNTIRELIGEGFLYGDICVLTRTKAKGALIVKMLSDENIPVVSSESLLLVQSAEVRFLLHFLRFLNDPHHPKFRFRLIEFILESSFCPWPKNELNSKLNFLCKTSVDGFCDFLKGLVGDFEITSWRSVSLIELCHKIIKAFRLNEAGRIYMQFLLNEVWVYSNKNTPDLCGFLNFWDEQGHKLSVAIPEGVNAVQVMTIHKSKGLEFPVVLFPFANWNATTERDAKLWVDINEPELSGLPISLIPLGKLLESSTPELQNIYKQHKSDVLLDNLNMLYVALTRPKTRLYIYTSQKGQGKNLSLFFDTFLKSTGNWTEGKTKYTFGEKLVKSPNVPDKNHEIPLTQPINNVYKILRISRQAPKVWDVDHPERDADKGRVVHEILSYIKTINDLDAALEKALRIGLINRSEEGGVRRLLEKTLKNKDVQGYFSPGLKIKNEEEILLNNGESLRPDRLVFKGNEVSIIDYKTGKASGNHKKQILAYKSHIELMGYLVKECVLIYINSGAVKLEVV